MIIYVYRIGYDSFQFSIAQNLSFILVSSCLRFVLYSSCSWIRIICSIISSFLCSFLLLIESAFKIPITTSTISPITYFKYLPAGKGRATSTKSLLLIYHVSNSILSKITQPPFFFVV